MPLERLFGGITIISFWIVMVVLFVVSLFLADKLEDYIPIPAPLSFIGIMIGLVYLIDAILGR